MTYLRRLALLTLLMLALASYSIASTYPSEFQVLNTDWGSETSSLSAALGDFNGDGQLDIAVANFGLATVSIFLGGGNGTFQAAGSYSAGLEPRVVASADFNGDGVLDLIVVNQSSGTVSILLGNGDGSFQSPTSYSAGSNPVGLAVSDFNGDGKPDVAVADSEGTGAVSVLLGNGDGSLQSAVSYSAGGLPSSIAAGNVNHDAVPDIVVGLMGPKAAAVLLGNGNGTFQPPVLTKLTFNPSSIVLGDFNNDGTLDLGISGEVTTKGIVATALGNGDGTFQAPVIVLVTPGELPISASVGDFNQDGFLDLATVSNASGNGVVAMLFGNGNGSFVTAQTYSVGSNPASVAAGDVNGDNYPDLIAVNEGSAGFSSESTLLNAGTSLFVTLSNVSLAFPSTSVGSTSARQAVKLTNTSTASLTISSVTVSGDFIVKNGCGSTLASNNSCNLTLQFRPRTTGTRKGVVTITDSASTSPQKVQLMGTGK